MKSMLNSNSLSELAKRVKLSGTNNLEDIPIRMHKDIIYQALKLLDEIGIKYDYKSGSYMEIKND